MPDIPMLYRRTKHSVRQSCFLWDGYLSSQLLAICVTVLQSQPYSSIIDVSASTCLCSPLILNFYPAKTCTCLTHHALCHGHPTTRVQTQILWIQLKPKSATKLAPHPSPTGLLLLAQNTSWIKKIIRSSPGTWEAQHTLTTSAIVTAYEVKRELCIGLKFPQSI